jgi:hypothetical protein
MASPEWWNRRVKAKYKELTTVLRLSIVLDDMLSEDVISLEDYRELGADRTEIARARRFLTEILPYGGEDRLDKFCEILARTDQQQHIIELLGKRTDRGSTEPVRDPASIGNEIMQGRAQFSDVVFSEGGQLLRQPVSLDLGQRTTSTLSSQTGKITGRLNRHMAGHLRCYPYD